MFKNLLKWFLAAGILTIGTLAVLEVQKAMALISGYFLSTIFVLSSAWVVDYFGKADNSAFMKAFLLSTVIRFAFVLLSFGILLSVTKIHEIFFTVSFIISYLFHSVTEMIYINKILRSSS